MFDRFKRDISYLRISVTDRCNLRCRYCMPEKGVQLMSHDDILAFEEIVEVVKTGVTNGINRVRLTGGEPLVRKGITELVRMIAKIEGVEEVSMTTNGIFLSQFAKELRAAGLKRVNISLDTMDAEKYRFITRGGDIEAVFRGIEAAREAGLMPIKLNCVIFGSSDEPDAKAVAEFASANGYKVQFIHQMDLETGHFSRVEGGEGGNCNSCNRLRLTANGCVKPCLFNEKGYNVREFGNDKAFHLAINNKPFCGSKNKSGKFYNLGG